MLASYNAHLCPYCNVWPKVVLQELGCLPNCLHVFIIRISGFHHFTEFCLSTPSEIAKVLPLLLNYMTIYVPIVMYGKKLFIVVLQELNCI